MNIRSTLYRKNVPVKVLKKFKIYGEYFAIHHVYDFVIEKHIKNSYRCSHIETGFCITESTRDSIKKSYNTALDILKKHGKSDTLKAIMANKKELGIT